MGESTRGPGGGEKRGGQRSPPALREHPWIQEKMAV